MISTSPVGKVGTESRRPDPDRRGSKWTQIGPGRPAVDDEGAQLARPGGPEDGVRLDGEEEPVDAGSVCTKKNGSGPTRRSEEDRALERRPVDDVRPVAVVV